MVGKRINIDEYIGKKYGRLTIVEHLGMISGKRKFLCRCDCGGESAVNLCKLKNGHTKSCGCLRSEPKHGETKSRLYRAWSDMKFRCHNKRATNYKNYGGRGITVCEEWRSSYEAFRDWALNNGYAEGLTIDRIDVNGNYEPSNCRWATVIEQNYNKRSNHYVTFRGETLPLGKWAERLGLPYKTILARINIGGWSAERALTTPVKQYKKRTSSSA